MSQGHSVNYGAGNMDLSAGNRVNDGYTVRGPGVQNAIPVDSVDSIAVSNVSSTWVRGIITIDPAFVGTTTGNTTFVIPPGGTFQESFGSAAIQSVSFVGVDVPAIAGVTSNAALIANAADYVLAVKFLEG